MVPSLWTVHMEMCEIQSLYKVVDLLLEQAISQRWKVGFRLGKNGELVSNGYRISIGEAKPRMRELDCEESWAPKNWCFWTVVLEKALESPLDCKDIQPVHSKGDQPWVFFGRNDAKAETPVLWPPHAKSWLTGKDSDAGRDWGQEEKVTTEDEMAGWHHQLDGREFDWTPGVGDGQEGLTCHDSWGRRESDTTERLNWTELKPRKWMVVTAAQQCKGT